MIAEPRIIFLVFLLAGAWFFTFALLIRALNIILALRAAIVEGRDALKLAAHILAVQDEVITSYRPPEPPTNRTGFQA